MLTRSEKRSAGSEYDEVHHQIREEHSRVHIRGSVFQIVIACAEALPIFVSGGAFLFDLSRGLPEKQIWRNCGAEQTDIHSEIIFVEANIRNKCVVQYHGPIRMSKKCR